MQDLTPNFWVTNATEGLNDSAQFVAATITGGTVSVIGGGKFSNGAVTAAMGYLFNRCVSKFGCSFMKMGSIDPKTERPEMEHRPADTQSLAVTKKEVVVALTVTSAAAESVALYCPIPQVKFVSGTVASLAGTAALALDISEEGVIMAGLSAYSKPLTWLHEGAGMSYARAINLYNVSQADLAMKKQ